jgi:hypothetical protein
LVIHSFNLKNGLICSGFDEDDPVNDEGHVLLPENFESVCSDIFSFRYKSTDGEQFILKIIPDNLDSSEAFLDLNCMSLKNNDEIHSCQIKIGHLDLTSKDKNKLDNLDSHNDLIT